MQPDCLKGRVVWETVYGDMHFKDLLGSIAKEWYHIPVLDFYLVLYCPRCRKNTLTDLINLSIMNQADYITESGLAVHT